MVLQYLVNGLVEASVIVLAATGLSLIYGVKKFANFAHGDMMTAGAYFALLLIVWLRAGVVEALLGAMVFVAFLGVLFEFLVFSRLEGRGPVAPLVASVGAALILQNAIRTVFGTAFTTYGIRLPETWYLPIRDPLTGFPIGINPLQGLVPLALATVLGLAVAALLKYTKLGKAMRATADNPDLARVSGIHVGLVRYATWALAGGLAGAAGVILAIRLTQLVPTLGAGVLLIVFAAVILGGIGSPHGAILGALVVGISRHLFFPVATRFGIPEEFSLFVPFAIMVTVLLIRPQGIAGRPIGFDLPPLRAELKKLAQSVGRVVRLWRQPDG